MANILPRDKQVQIIAALAERNSIRSIERQTGVHRDTIMRLGVRVGEGCQMLLDAKMRNLTCSRIEIDELWGFVQKKQRNVTSDDNPMRTGDVWTFLSIDPQSKIIPAFLVGKRDLYHARFFLEDLAARLSNRVQLSSDAMKAYPEAVERAFGGAVDYGQIVKTGSDQLSVASGWFVRGWRMLSTTLVHRCPHCGGERLYKNARGAGRGARGAAGQGQGLPAHVHARAQRSTA